MSKGLSPHQRIVFLVSPFVPFPPARGIELRIFRLLQWMKKEGYRVVLVVPTESIEAEALAELQKITHAIHFTRLALRTRIGIRYPRLRMFLWESIKSVHRRFKRGAIAVGSPNTRVLQKKDGLSDAMSSQRRLGDDQIKGRLASDKLVQLVSKLARKYRPHAIIVEYMFSVPVFAGVSGRTLKIVDTIDVFSRKEDQVLAYGIADPLACSEEQERIALLQADVIIAIQSREARLLKQLVPEREVLLAGMDVDVASSSHEKDIIPDRVVVVASDNALNVHGLTSFLSECWPSIKAAWPKSSLHVVGRVGEMCRVDDPAIRYSGWIDDLDQIYREASVVINPTVAGTGLKIKSVQALAHGKPLVAWTNGIEGLDFSGEPPFRECHSWKEFAEAVVSLLRSEPKRSALASRALAYAGSEFAADTVYAALRERLNRGVGEYVNSMPDTVSSTGNPRCN